MSDLTSNLFACSETLEKAVGQMNAPQNSDPIQRVRDAANRIGKAWSGSWLGYQSCVYYQDLDVPPPGAHFSSEWGAHDRMPMGETRGSWAEYTFDDVRSGIFLLAGVESLASQERIAKGAAEAFENAREQFLSTITMALRNDDDLFLSRLKADVEKTSIGTKFDFATVMQPRGRIMSRDVLAMTQGIKTPPHIVVLAEITVLAVTVEKCDKLAKTLRRAALHLETKERHADKKRLIGTHVFIGHGHSPLWKDLKDFISERLGLPWDEFNRVPVAGVTNIARLGQMLDDAALAFIIMTAEDEQPDGKLRARMNVVHEAGLFQGRLGFSKAILLLEEGCEEFSNVNGLGQIRFPKNNIKAVFEEIRLVLEREDAL